ncbi:pyruvate, water dikinase [Spiractinospora alimapuensis]|uniref:PEP/pyruvate-binding domain-containing protein n=1 Tax=Spiractinospora alimapuensis TaxID=2820884 RepID=UPI001EEB8F9A|nr:PEP/pyruvate-binding domain-containing protein [Spiractinospora alimapuensis]QVQ52605.1 pyruvate, water dikinase [Spiractinospora alimapuensis]
MDVIPLAEARASMLDLVGGKAARLGEMIRAGERVPDGFCLTTEPFRRGEIPREALRAAYARLGEDTPVAVRSSATAEDLPEASFAGQQDTLLDVVGVEALLDAVQRCWDSLTGERAVAYRRAHTIDDAAMAVVVQRMVRPRAAGVLFTANPLTNARTEMVVDAVAGLGTGVVDGARDTDHYVLGEDALGATSGCLGREDLAVLRAAGQRLQHLFGAPQDAEWAIDTAGTLWLLQSRPITTLFPLPPAKDADTHLYFHVGHMQGLVRPVTPMGMSLLHQVLVDWLAGVGVSITRAQAADVMTAVGGRMYVDLTPFLRDRTTRDRLGPSLSAYGPTAAKAVRHALSDPRFAPRPGRSVPWGPSLRVAASLAGPLIAGTAAALARPAHARAKAFASMRRTRDRIVPLGPTVTAERELQRATGIEVAFMRVRMGSLIPPLGAGMLAQQVPRLLLRGVADTAEISAVFRGMPHNVTTEMDLALWEVSRRAAQHGDLLRDTPPAELAERYLAGTLPEFGLSGFLRTYGHRAAGEVDVGNPRWREDPTPVLAAIAGYLRVEDPEQAPPRRFARAAEEAQRHAATLVRRAGRTRPVRAWLAGFFLQRARELGGLRELPKFVWLYALAESRRSLLAVGERLRDAGRLAEADDVMFLDLTELGEMVRHGVDHRALVAQRRAVHARESRRHYVPGVLLSDGTDVEAELAAPDAPEGTLVGMAAAPGRATGPARVVRDPRGAEVRPGEILVAPTTDPGWTPLFMTAAGLVTETGSPIAHGPTVAREYGIPAAICVRDATTLITTGDVITVDGSAGRVEFVQDPQASPRV